MSYQEFLQFLNKKCFYCRKDIQGIGIDRVDNQKGYSLSNAVACCTVCNYMKRQMSKSDFIQHCQQIVKTHC